MIDELMSNPDPKARIGKHFLFDIQTIPDYRGKIGVLESNKTVPFEIKRTYYLYDVPSEAERGAHAHKRLEQVIIALSGSFKIIIDDGKNTYSYNLRSPSVGLYMGPHLWRDIKDFSSNSVALVLASMHYSEDDYIRSYDDFRTVF